MPYTNTKTVDTSSGLTFQYNRVRRTWSPVSGWSSTPWNGTQPAGRDPRRKVNVKNWNRTPNYKALLASQGYLPTTEFYLTEWSQEYSPHTSAVWKNKTIYEWWDEPTYHRTLVLPSDVTGSGWPTNSELSNLQADAEHKVLAKARDMKVNLPVMFGEGRKTINMLTDTATRLGNAYLSFLRKDFKRAAKYLDMREPTGGLARHWLAYQYGWRPLISDAQGLSELASEQLDEYQQRPPRFTVTAKQEMLRDLKYSSSNGFSGYATGSVVYGGKVYVKAKAGLTVEVIFRESSLMAQLGMSSITDGLLLAWELVPFSFVFDWFVKVGQYLESASALSGLRVLAGYSRYEILTRELEGKSVVAPNSTYYLESGVLHPMTGRQRRYYRRSYMGAQPEMVVYGLDALGNSTNRLRSAAALFRTLCIGDRARGAYRP